MNPDLQAFQRSFILEVCRFAEMERKLRFMESEMKQNDVPIHEQKTDPKAVPLQEMAQFEVWTLDFFFLACWSTVGNLYLLTCLVV